jgi:hypothetical protein
MAPSPFPLAPWQGTWGVASSAVYRHVKNRDGLLTLLLIEAFDGLAVMAE